MLEFQQLYVLNDKCEYKTLLINSQLTVCPLISKSCVNFYVDLPPKHEQDVSTFNELMSWQKMGKDCNSKSELIAGLRQAALGTTRTKTARLREIFDEVEAAKAKGLRLQTIVDILAGRGLEFNLETFVNIRHRIKKERSKEQHAAEPPVLNSGAAVKHVPPQPPQLDQPEERKVEKRKEPPASTPNSDPPTLASMASIKQKVNNLDPSQYD